VWSVFCLIGDILPNSETKNEKKERSDFGGFRQISIFDFQFVAKNIEG
jgi:hypothetical protein